MKILKTKNIEINFYINKKHSRFTFLKWKGIKCFVKTVYLFGGPEKYYGHYLYIDPIENGSQIFRGSKYFIYHEADGVASIAFKFSEKDIKNLLLKECSYDETKKCGP